MADLEKVIKGSEWCISVNGCVGCPYEDNCLNIEEKLPGQALIRDALERLKEQEKEIKALRLLVEWAEECDFGFDQFHDEYERYKEEIKDMDYIEGMIHVAKRTIDGIQGICKGHSCP